MGTSCGQMRKRVWVNRSWIWCWSLWEGMTDDTKCSIVHKYSEDEVKRLLKEGELPANFKLNLDDLEFEDDNGFMTELQVIRDDSDESIRNLNLSQNRLIKIIDIDEI